MPNRSIRDERQADRDGNQTSPARNKISPPTQSAFGPVSSSDPAPPPAKAVPGDDPATKDLSVAGAVKAIQQHKYALDKAIDDAS